MINKIVFLNYQSLTNKIVEDFFFQEFEKKGYTLEYWDLSKLVFEKKITVQTKVDKYPIIQWSSLEQFETQVQKQNLCATIFISLVTYEFRVIKIFKVLTKYNCKLTIFARGVQPSVSNNINRKTYVLRKIISLFYLKNILNLVLNKYAWYLKKNGKIKLYDIVFCAGNEGLRAIGQGYEFEKKSSVIKFINTIDYDKFLKNSSEENELPDKYCVFLDEYLPYHPDFFLLKIKTINPDLYYKSLNKYFDFIQEKFKIKVIIAAHPKAELYSKINPFEGRKIYTNKTEQLVRFSEFVIAHNTTSISYAILNKKQINVITSNHIIDFMPNYNLIIENNAIIIGTSLINIDSFDKKHFELPKICKNKYECFKYDFLTTLDSEMTFSFDIIESNIKFL